MTLTAATAPAHNLGNTEDEMAERIPSKLFVAQGRPQPSGKFHALYSAPGLLPDLVKDPTSGVPREFDTDEEAQVGALFALIGVLNAPRRRFLGASGHRKARPAKIGGPEFAALLRAAGLQPSELAYITDKPVDRIFGWIDGKQDIPHEIRLLLELFNRDAVAIDIAYNVTDDAVAENGE